jgi:hypothetical protein
MALFSRVCAVALAHEGDTTPGRRTAECLGEKPVPAWLQGRGGQPEGYCHRQMLDAIRYLVAGGSSWRDARGPP